MTRRGQAAVAAVSRSRGEGVPERTAGMDLETDFGEDFKRDGRDAGIADA